MEYYYLKLPIFIFIFNKIFHISKVLKTDISEKDRMTTRSYLACFIMLLYIAFVM